MFANIIIRVKQQYFKPVNCEPTEDWNQIRINVKEKNVKPFKYAQIEILVLDNNIQNSLNVCKQMIGIKQNCKHVIATLEIIQLCSTNEHKY